MLIKFSKKLFEDINDGKMDRFGLDEYNFRYGTTSVSIEVEDMERKLLEELQGIVSRSKVFGAKVCAKDIGLWLEMLDETEKSGSTNEFANMKVRKVEFFATYLRKYFAKSQLHRVYVRDDQRGVTYCSYIYDIDYHARYETSRGEFIPEHVTFDLAWTEFGESSLQTYHFYAEDCSHYQKVKESLRLKNIYFSDKVLDKQYEKSIKKFNAIFESVGEQYLATGTGTDDVEENNDRHWWSRSSSAFVLDKGGEPANVVIDIFRESDEEKNRGGRKKEDSIEHFWWESLSGKDFDITEQKVEELPIHPNLVIFTLKKQKRLRVHVDQLVKYAYDHSMGDKLILPKESMQLVSTLVSYKGGFQDIVKNKGGGAIVLCTGIPGTGKTLTAEVYAEVMERPLYTVQCSQLGTDPEELEKELLTVFSRSERWNAILLLDEADVYIRSRGDDLQQNAIVGVFLRVLEYYRGVLFMTTNRADIVDDAIASRCIAKIDYVHPTASEAMKIWRVLADIQGIPVTDKVIKEIVQQHGKLAGRDIKNLLKLVKLTQDGTKKSLTLKKIDFVKQFNPTR